MNLVVSVPEFTYLLNFIHRVDLEKKEKRNIFKKKEDKRRRIADIFWQFNIIIEALKAKSTLHPLTVSLSKSHPTLCDAGYGDDIYSHRRTRLSSHDNGFSSFRHTAL